MYKTNMYKASDDQFRGQTKEPAPQGTETPLAPNGGHTTIGELSRDFGVSLRALRFYQSKGLLSPQRHGNSRIFCSEDRARLALIQQGKRLGFTLCEIRDMLARRRGDGAQMLPIDRKKCVEQIRLLEHQRQDIDQALAELRRIYTAMSVAIAPDMLDPARGQRAKRA
jgi:DNA-binding transcriptional MerR regulator